MSFEEEEHLVMFFRNILTTELYVGSRKDLFCICWSGWGFKLPKSRRLGSEAMADPDRYALVVCVSDYDHMKNLPGAKSDRGRIIQQLESLRFQVSSPPTDRVTRKELEDAVKEFLQKIAKAALLQPWLIVFVWFAGHGLQEECDHYPYLMASDSHPIAAECFGTRNNLICSLNSVVAVPPGRLRVASVFECCRENPQDLCFSRGPGHRKLFRRLRNDFYTIFACDPGKKACETEQGGVLAEQLLLLLPYEARISQIFYEAARRVGHQRAWVEARPGDFEPVLGDRPGDFPVLLGHTDGSKTEAPQVLGLPNDDLSPMSGPSEAGSFSDFDIFRLYWLPALTLLVLLIHGLLLLLWLCDLVEKRYVTRLAIMPVLSIFGTAQILQGPDGDDVPAHCGSATFRRLRPLWCLLDKYSMNGHGAGCFFLLAFGEITKENDWVAAAVSCVLATISIGINDKNCRMFSSLRERSSDSSHRRNGRLWLCLCIMSGIFALRGRDALLSGADSAGHEVEANFHFFLLVYLGAKYMSFFHDSDPALSGCSNSSSQGVCTYMLVPLLAISNPLIQSICQSAKFDISWSWQIWLLVECSGLFFVVAVCYKFRQAQAETTPADEQTWVMLGGIWSTVWFAKVRRRCFFTGCMGIHPRPRGLRSFTRVQLMCMWGSAGAFAVLDVRHMSMLVLLKIQGP